MTTLWKCTLCDTTYTAIPAPKYYNSGTYITNNHCDCLNCGAGYDAAFTAQN